jgi:hypothetical protein
MFWEGLLVLLSTSGLYRWRQRYQKPKREIFTTCVEPGARGLISGEDLVVHLALYGSENISDWFEKQLEGFVAWEFIWSPAALGLPPLNETVEKNRCLTVHWSRMCGLAL